MPSVRNVTTPAEGGIPAMRRVASKVAAAIDATGKAVPKQQDAHVEQECT